MVYGIVKDPELAEDVLQDIFINVYNKLDSFKFKAAFATWLYRIAVNMSYNAIKKRRISKPISDLNRLPQSLISERELLKTENQRTFINQALAAIKTEEALVLRLFYLCEMSVKEVTKVTGFSTSKVKVNLHRGRSNLNFQLSQLLGDEIKDLL